MIAPSANPRGAAPYLTFGLLMPGMHWPEPL